MECSDSKVGFVRSVEGYIHLLPKCVCIVALITQIISNLDDHSNTHISEEELKENRKIEQK